MDDAVRLFLECSDRGLIKTIRCTAKAMKKGRRLGRQHRSAARLLLWRHAAARRNQHWPAHACRRGTVWQEAAVIDLHSLTPATAKVALVTWFRYLRFLAEPHGGANPWPERKTAVVVTGAPSDGSAHAPGTSLACHLRRYLKLRQSPAGAARATRKAKADQCPAASAVS